MLVPQRQRSERSLDVLNFVLADVRYGLGPYGVVYLVAAHGWSEVDIAFAYIFGSIAGLVTQTPIGAMVDAVRSKRALAASALTLVAISCFAVPFAPTIAPVAAAGVAGALANSTLGMTIAAISLGVVGPEHFPRRAARNEAFFHAGSAAINVAVLALTPIFGISIVFWLLAGAAVASIVAVCAVPAGAINHDAARGMVAQNKERDRSSLLRTLMVNKPLMAFAGCGALFHMANASMLGVVVQRAALIDPANAVPLAAASMIAAQAAMVGTAALVGAKAQIWGRKPFFLAAYAALALRGALYTLSDAPAWTVAVQLLDGVGVGVFGALFPVFVADLMRGTGHFNAAQGAVGTVHGIGGLAGGPFAAACIMWAGYDAAFLALASIAALGGMAFLATVPETRNAASVAARTDGSAGG